MLLAVMMTGTVTSSNSNRTPLEYRLEALPHQPDCLFTLNVTRTGRCCSQETRCYYFRPEIWTLFY